MAELVFTVSKLSEYASRVLKNDPRLRSIKVSGEISGFKRHSSGHLYFNLKDSDASINCVLFRSYAAGLKIVPGDGMKVVVHGSADIYPRDGRFQLYVDSIQEDGIGELYRQFLELKDKLGKEGLFENERPLPYLPRTIGVATSETGAAIKDIVTVVRRRFPTMNILLAPCLVQGVNAPNEIANAVTALQRVKGCDVIIVGRGGGSYEDLSCFNDETVAMAIFNSSVPVVSAVGHETDFTIADFAADLRAPTPSAAAELCCPKLSDLYAELSYLGEEAYEIVSDALFEARTRLDNLSGSAAMAGPGSTLSIMLERLKTRESFLLERASSAVASNSSVLSGTVGRLKALDPEAVINRGYSIITDVHGNPVTGINGLSEDMEIGVRMSGGRAEAVVKRVANDE